MIDFKHLHNKNHKTRFTPEKILIGNNSVNEKISSRIIKIRLNPNNAIKFVINKTNKYQEKLSYLVTKLFNYQTSCNKPKKTVRSATVPMLNMGVLHLVWSK